MLVGTLTGAIRYWKICGQLPSIRGPLANDLLRAFRETYYRLMHHHNPSALEYERSGILFVRRTTLQTRRGEAVDDGAGVLCCERGGG